MELRNQDVHVWQVDLDDAVSDPLAWILSRDEEARAQRFARRELQLRYRRCRTAVRAVLGQYLDCSAGSLRFNYGRFGKPELAGQPLCFNVSHSEAYALIAVARRPVGIDIEMLNKPGVDTDELASLVCHPLESRVIATLPTASRKLLFFRLWTQKEAYCKAIGLGLQRSLPALRLQAAPTSAAARVIDEQAGDRTAYFVHDLPPIAGHAASLCLPCEQAHIRMHAYTCLPASPVYKRAAL